MGGFRELKPGQTKKVVLRTKGPRSTAQAKAFRKALLKLIAKYKTRVVGSPAKAKASATPAAGTEKKPARKAKVAP